MFSIFGVAIFALFAWLFAWLSSAILRFVLSPLDVPLDLEQRRERRVTRIAYISQFLSYLGTVILLVTYIVGTVRHFKAMSIAERNHAPIRHPIIPRFTISDLLVMVFSLGFFPVISAQLTQGMGDFKSGPAIIFITGAISFPAYFICALYRLETNNIPAGWTRSAFLFVAPYVFHACAACITAPFYLLILSTRTGIDPTMYLVFYGSMLFLGRFIAARAGALIRPDPVAAAVIDAPVATPLSDVSAGAGDTTPGVLEK